MDYDSSTKFISSLAKFLQSLCNGYVEFDNGVQVIGHLYLSVDTGKTIDYILNEKVCKTDENSVTFISNSFHAQPAERPKPPGKKTYEKDSKLEDTSENQTSNLEPRSTNFGTLPTRIAQNSPHSQNLKRAFSPSSKHIKDDGSPLKLGRSSPKHKKNRTESMDQNLSQTSNPASENSISSQPSPAADGIGASVSAQGTDVIHGSQYTDSYQQNFFQTGDEDNSVADESDERDIKPSIDTDVTFIKEEFAPSSCSQSGGQNRDRNHGEDSSAYYHSNQSFPASNFTSQAGFGGSVRSNFGSSADRSSLYTSGPASSQLEGENSGDPSDLKEDITTDFLRLIAAPTLKAEDFDALKFQVASTPLFPGMQTPPKHKEQQMDVTSKDFTAPLPEDDFIPNASLFSADLKLDNSFMSSYNAWKKQKPSKAKGVFQCDLCGKEYSYKRGLRRHMWVCADVKRFQCEYCAQTFNLREQYRKHLKDTHSDTNTAVCNEMKQFQVMPE